MSVGEMICAALLVAEKAFGLARGWQLSVAAHGVPHGGGGLHCSSGARDAILHGVCAPLPPPPPPDDLYRIIPAASDQLGLNTP